MPRPILQGKRLRPGVEGDRLQGCPRWTGRRRAVSADASYDLSESLAPLTSEVVAPH